MTRVIIVVEVDRDVPNKNNYKAKHIGYSSGNNNSQNFVTN